MDGDRRDIVLGAGQSFTVNRGGKTLVHAELPSTVRISDRPQRHATRALWQRFARAIEGWATRSLDRSRPAPYY